MKNIVKISFLIVFASTLIVATINFIYKTISLDKKHPYENYELWAHRGFHINYEQNSIGAFSAALKTGFKGIELDVFYDNSLNKFVVQHDTPYRIDTTSLFLENVFERFGDSLRYWIDLKNLNKQNVDNISDRLLSLFVKYKTGNKCYIESAKGYLLQQLAKRNIQCLYWVQFGRSILKRTLKTTYIKWLLLTSDFVGITTHHRLYDNLFIHHFGNESIYVFTVNDAQTLKKMDLSTVKVILTDEALNSFK